MAAGCHRRSREEYKFCNRVNTRINMAIQQKVINDSQTEIYVGGGNYLTQAAPTNFHRFYTRKILTGGESADDFREVTAAEKAALEASDAAWSRPSQAFIDMWNEACRVYQWTVTTYGCFNEETGYFELNGIKDITYAQAINIYRYTSGATRANGNVLIGMGFAKYRTNLPPTYGSYVVAIGGVFMYNSELEVLRLPQYYDDAVRLDKNTREAFFGCRKLREIVNVMQAPAHVSDSSTWFNTFSSCKSLETVRIKGLYGAISFPHSALLSLESIEYMIQNRTTAHTNAITITLHPQAYARVTDELFALAAEKNITIATT